VLVHEGICDSRMWGPQWKTFPRTRRTIRYDLRGYGRSPFPAGPYSHARDLLVLLEDLEVEHASLVGASVGGRIALEVALARPRVVDALVLVGSGLRGHAWSEETTEAWQREQDAFERGDLDEAVELALRLWVDGPRRAPEDVDPEVRELVRTMQRSAYELARSSGFSPEEDDLLVPDMASRLGEIAVPTLVLAGEEDVPDIHMIADRLAAEIPGARRARIAAAAHVPSLERPREFDELVLPFLEAVVAPQQNEPAVDQ
jgi:3-oxoadipate enol-lactonase